MCVYNFNVFWFWWVARGISVIVRASKLFRTPQGTSFTYLTGQPNLGGAGGRRQTFLEQQQPPRAENMSPACLVCMWLKDNTIPCSPCVLVSDDSCAAMTNALLASDRPPGDHAQSSRLLFCPHLQILCIRLCVWKQLRWCCIDPYNQPVECRTPRHFGQYRLTFIVSVLELENQRKPELDLKIYLRD